MKAAITTIFGVVILSGCKPSAPPPPAVPEPYTTGEQVLQAMRDRYGGRWYKTLTFVQSNTAFGAGGKQDHSVWYEAAQLPSRLRIDFDPISGGNGVLVRADTQYVMQRGKLARTIARTNDLLLLGFDVYFFDPAFTAAWLKREGFDLTRVRRDMWEGRQVYVVGARAADDLRSRQFWIDRDNLLFVRLLEPSARDSATIDDIRFSRYERIGSAWVAPLVEVYNNNQPVWREEYQHIRINQELDSTLFVPAQWSTARHWYQAR